MSIKRQLKWELVMGHIEDLDPVEELPWKYGSKDVYVFKDDGKHWRVTIYVHREEGWQKEDPIEVESVVPCEKVITEWIPELKI